MISPPDDVVFWVDNDQKDPAHTCHLNMLSQFAREFTVSQTDYDISFCGVYDVVLKAGLYKNNIMKSVIDEDKGGDQCPYKP